MATEGHKASIGGAATILRVVERRKRLQQALTRAEGEKKEALKAELTELTEILRTIKNELDDLGD